jgi:hypothetical protein
MITVTINVDNAEQLWSQLHGFLGRDLAVEQPVAEAKMTRKSSKAADPAPVAETKAELEKAKVDPFADDAPTESAPALTKEDVVQAAMKLAQAKDGDTLNAVLEQFGVEKISALDPKQYPEVVAALAL